MIDRTYTGPAVMAHADYDIDVTITGWAGESDGEQFFSDQNNSFLPGSQLFKTTQEAEAARQWTVLREHLHRGGNFAYWWTFEDKRSTWWPADKPAQTPIRDRINTYFSVHPSTEIPTTNSRGESKPPEVVRSQIPYIAAINCVFAELDAKEFVTWTEDEIKPELLRIQASAPNTKPPVVRQQAIASVQKAKCKADLDGSKALAMAYLRTFALPPSVIVDSGGGYHCYWLLRTTFTLATPEDRERARQLQRSWVAYAGGDDGAKDLPRVLRVPGSRNWKYAGAPEVRIVEANFSRLYNLPDLETLCKPPEQVTADTGAYWLDRALNDAYDGNRDNTGFWLACQLRDNGVTQQDAEPTMRDYARRVPANPSNPYSEGSALKSLASAYGRGKRDAARPADDSGADAMAAEAATPTLATPSNHILLDSGADDEGNAQCVYQMYQGQFLYCTAYGWMHYNGQFWQSANAEEYLERAIIFTLQTRRIAAVRMQKENIVRAAQPSAKRVRDCKFNFRSLVPVDVAEFDKSPESLNCGNGVLNLRTGTLLPHESSQRFTYCLPIEYQCHADQSVWTEFMKTVVAGGEIVLNYLQQVVGYSLTGCTQEECLFYVFGPTRSGKGTFSETLLALLPHPIAIEVDFTTFTAPRDADSQNFDLAPLKPARLVFASESNKYQTLNTGKIKAMTGGNYVRCAFKHRDHFSYRPQYKIWLVSNHSINADVDDDATWNRVRSFEFPNSFAGCEDKSLKARMKAPETLQGVLAWAVEGAKAWFASETGLVTPDAVANWTKQQRADLDFVRSWLDECTTVDPNGWESNENVYRSYSEWCKSNGVKPKEQRGLSLSLKQKGYQIGVSQWVGNAAKKGVAISIR